MRHSPTHPEPWVLRQGESMVTCFPDRPVSVAAEPLLGIVLWWPCLDLCATPGQHLPREPWLTVSSPPPFQGSDCHQRCLLWSLMTAFSKPERSSLSLCLHAPSGSSLPEQTTGGDQEESSIHEGMHWVARRGKLGMLKSGSSTRGYPYPPTASKPRADRVTEVRVTQGDAPHITQQSTPMLTSQRTLSGCYLDLY